MATVSLPPFMRGFRMALVALMTGVVATACVPIGNQSEPPPAELEPEFAPETATADFGTTAPTAPSTPATQQTPTDAPQNDSDNSEPAPTTDPTDFASSPSPTTAAPFTGTATVTDPPSDRTATLESSPDWADLETITIDRDGDAMTLTIGLTGGAPDTAPDDQHTMNIATFFDVDGDGFLDYEIWANVSDTGWGTAYYDNVEGQARFADDDGIEIGVVAGQVVMTFDAALLGRAERFRFATSSEYGRYETIGTELMARDDAPDDDQPAHFPG